MGVCISPWQKEHGSKIMDLPCGRCYQCRSKRAAGWSFRLVKEAEVSTSAFFVTLTYENPPITSKKLMTLQKDDVQKFMKRLRKHEKDNKIRYYAVGEYGSKTDRPHYHIILFNAKAENVAKAWKKGHIHLDEVNPQTVNYTLKYISKEGKIPKWEGDDRIPEFQLMSKGLGANYITENMRKWHKADIKNRLYVPLKDGKKVSMPRYYKDKLYTVEERQKIGKYLKNKALQEENEQTFSTRLENFSKERLIHINETKKMYKNGNKQNKF
jgi:hypothetical protein